MDCVLLCVKMQHAGMSRAQGLERKALLAQSFRLPAFGFQVLRIFSVGVDCLVF